MANATHLYVAYAPCGCISGCVVDQPDHPADVARTVGEFVIDGQRIERQPLPFSMAGDCPHTPKWGQAAHGTPPLT